MFRTKPFKIALRVVLESTVSGTFSSMFCIKHRSCKNKRAEDIM